MKDNFGLLETLDRLFSGDPHSSLTLDDFLAGLHGRVVGAAPDGRPLVKPVGEFEDVDPQPVDAAGNAVGDPGFQVYLDLMRTQLAAGLPPSYVASAIVQVLTEAKPPPAVAAGSWAKVGRVRGGNDLWAATATAENARSPFPFVEAKAAPADGAGVASVVDGVAADVRNAAAVVVGKG